MVLDCRPDSAQDRHIQFDDGEAGEDMVVKEGLSAYKRYKLRIGHANGGEHLRDVTRGLLASFLATSQTRPKMSTRTTVE